MKFLEIIQIVLFELLSSKNKIINQIINPEKPSLSELDKKLSENIDKN